MYNFDIFDRAEPFNIYLCKPDGSFLYQLNGIDEESTSITINMNNQYELSFDYNRFINTYDGELIESNGYHSLNIGMGIFVDKIGYFRMKYPPLKFDGDKEYKSVNAFSIESELEIKDLVGFKINTGEKDSLEYLVKYDDNETEELINAYTNLPYDYIVFYNTFSEQLSLLLNKYMDGSMHTSLPEIEEIKSYCELIPRLKSKSYIDNNGSISLIEYVEYTYDNSGENVTSIYLASNFNERISQLITFYKKYKNQLSLLNLAIEKCNCNWSIGMIDNSLVNKKFQFDVDGVNIYSFLTNDVSGTVKCIFSFDLFKKTINAVLVDHIGKGSGIVIDKRTLMNTLEVTCNDDSIYTRYNVSGGNNIGIQYVNFGISRIDDISYFLNVRDDKGKRIYVSDELARKYEQFVIDRNIAREKYISYTKEYNQCLIDIDEIKYRVPNDNIKNDWDTFTDEELEGSLITYNQLLVTLKSLYKEDYGTIGCNSDGSINENYIKNTEYWHDYYAYKTIIVQIESVINARANGDDDKNILDSINAYETEWSLYGIIELQNKIKTYNNKIKVLIDSEAVILKPNSEEAKRWSELSEDEKIKCCGAEIIKYQYDVYMDLYEKRMSCQEYLDILMPQLVALENKCNLIKLRKDELVKLVTVETYDRNALGKLITLPSSTVSCSFTDDEIKIINLLYMDTNYSNENILTTSLDNIVSEIDVQYELLHDAEEQLSIESQPQIIFKTDIDNLLCMPEFKNFDFNVGNYVTVEYYDDYYIDLRLYTISFNPCVPESSLTVTFTNYIKSKSKRSDISYILEQSMNNNSSGGSSGGTSGNNLFGTSKDIDVTISNTMLSKLLNTEMFGTRVSNIILDTIKVNQITAKFAEFNGLAKGTTTIDGACISTGAILSNNYNGTIRKNTSGVVINYGLDNTEGSIINLHTGEFSFGGGNLSFGNDKKLKVNGEVVATSGYIGGISGFNIGSEYIRNGNIKNAENTSIAGVYVGTDGFNISGGTPKTTAYFTKGGMNVGGKLIWDGSTLSVEGKITASSDSIIGGWTIGNDEIYAHNNSLYTTLKRNGNVAIGLGSPLPNDTTGAKAQFFHNGAVNLGHTSSGYNFIVDSSGNVSMKGSITATSGSISGFTIDTDKIYAGDASSGTIVIQKPSENTMWSFAVGGTNHNNYSDSPFRVSHKGTLYATDVNISGIISGSEISGGKISGSTITSSGFMEGMTDRSDNSDIAINYKTETTIIDGIITTNSLMLKVPSDFSSVGIYLIDDGDRFDNHILNSISLAPEKVTFSSPVQIGGGTTHEFSNNMLQVSGRGFFDSDVCPSFDETCSCGLPGHKWIQVYAGKSEINTSDINKKHHIQEISDKYEKLFFRLKPVSFMFRDGDRTHIGIIAQHLKESMDSVGLEDTELSAYCKDLKYKTVKNENGDYIEIPDLDENGNEQYDFGVRYSEFIMLNTHMIQKLYAELQSLKKEIYEMRK